jgi:Flp pilus assembly pilin Flp
MSKLNLKTLVARFNRDENGLEAMQVVMIVAIAATILIAVMAFGNQAAEWLGDEFATLKDTDITVP